MSLRLTDRASIPKIISEMTLEEKALLCTGETQFTTYPIERFGIPKVCVLDGATGINLGQLYSDIVYLYVGKENSYFDGLVSEVVVSEIREKLPNRDIMTEEAQKVYDVIMKYMSERMPKPILPGCFPPGMLLGATMNPEIAYNCGSAVAREQDAYGVDVVLGPNVNIHRDPRNGRIYEGYSEDPCLVSEMAPSFVKGIEDEGLLADIKHFAANNQESFRQNIDEKISERALREIYFPGFKACVDAGVKTIMSAYNAINGTPCAMNKWLLKDVLRDEWGFEGMVVSDWGAAYNKAKAIEAGNDLDMPGPRDVRPIIDAVNNGTLSMEDLDDAVANILKMILLTRTFKGEGRKYPLIDVEYSKRIAYYAASEGITLLKNNNILPLDKGIKLSFFGEASKQFVESGFGSTYIRTDRSTSLIKECGLYADKCRYNDVKADDDVVIICVRATGQEGSDRDELRLDAGERECAIDALSKAKELGKKVVLILNVAGPVDIREYENDCDAIICVYLPGMEGGHALADILFGIINPSGKLPITFPKKIEDVPAYFNFPGTRNKVIYGEDIFVGYRYYEKKKIKPMYAFGHGLSYTSFEISDLKLSSSVINTDENGYINVTVNIQNTGTVDGKDTIQMYISDVNSTLIKPEKELKAFKKIFLKAGETKIISFKITIDMLKSYDDDIKAWTVEPGEYQVLIGDASDKISVEGKFCSEGFSPYNFCYTTGLNKILAHSEARKLMYECIEQCGWDAGKLDEAAIYFPDRQILEEIKITYPYEEKKEIWESFFESIKSFA